MDIVVENFEGVGVAKVPVEDASGGLKACESSSPSSPAAAAAASSIQAPFLPSLEFSAVSFPSPVQLEPHSLFPHIPVPSVSAATLTAAKDAQARAMSVTSVEASTTPSMSTVFSSSTLVSSAPSSLPNDTAGLVMTPSSSSLLDLSTGAPGIALTASSISSSHMATPTYSPSLTTSLPLATSTRYSSADMIQASSKTLSADDARPEFLGCSPRGDTLQPAEVPSAVLGLESSGPLLTPLPTSLAPMEGPLPHPETSSPQVADIAEKIETSSFSPIELSKHQQRSTTVLPSSSSPIDNNTTAALLTSTSSRSESQPGAPCYPMAEKLPTALPSRSESNLEMSPSIAPLPSPDVRETDPVALSPVGASTGLLSEHERTSLETSTSFPPSGTSTITIPSPSLISKLPPTTSPSRSISKIPNPLSVSSNRSSVGSMIASSLLNDPASAYSRSTSYLALLSSVEKGSSSSPLAARQMPQYPLTSSSLSSSPSFGPLSTSNVNPDSNDSSFPLQEPISGIKSSGHVGTLTTVALSIDSLSSLATSYNSSTVCNSASSYLPAGSGDSMDFSSPPSSHFANVSSSNCANNTIQISPSTLELKSTKEELRSKSGPPGVPTSKTLPRRPVKAGQKAEGWPYAPQGWPEPDDKWPWKVGKRVHVHGYFRDRYLGLPKSLCKGRKTTEFASKRSIVEYLKENFPDLSVENFFKSFQWRIPSVNSWNSFSGPALKVNTLKRQRPAEEDTDAPSLPKRSRKGECKAGNPKCGLETGRSILLEDHVVLACDICCTEPGFCRECKCILCCKTIVPDAGESNFVRCLLKPSGNSMCGHAAHLECALHSKMAGVVKKRGLDMEYLCRRCDNRTDLRELVTLLLEAVGNTEVRTQAEKSLELALEVMKGTERGGNGARVLEVLVQTALRKVQSGVDIQEVFKELKDQGAAAEVARQQHLGRSSSLMEDASQQPEASLDQWLPSAGSPSSHPSPGTPSSFTSPRLRSNPSVTSGQINGGTQAVDGSLRKHRAAEGHTEHFGEPQTSNEVVSNSKYKNSHLGNKTLMRNAGQARGSHRIRAVTSNVNKNGVEAICDSFTTRTPGDYVAEPGSWDGNSSQRANQNSNSGTKNLKDQRNPSSAAGKLSEENEMCKSCGAVRHHTTTAVEITSSLKSSKTEDGGKKVVKSPSTPTEDEPGDFDAYRQVAENDTGVDGNGRPRRACTANGSAHKSMSTSLQLVDRQCEQEMRVALQKLRRAQEAEFQRAEACLTAKKKSILKKYELLEATRRAFSEQPVSSSLEAFDDLLLRTGNQFAGAKEERDSFKTMLKVAEGFGSVSKDDLKKLYRWPPEK